MGLLVDVSVLSIAVVHYRGRAWVGSGERTKQGAGMGEEGGCRGEAVTHGSDPKAGDQGRTGKGTGSITPMTHQSGTSHRTRTDVRRDVVQCTGRCGNRGQFDKGCGLP